MRFPLLPLALCTLLCSGPLLADSPTEQAAAEIKKGEFIAAERLIEKLALAKKPDPVAVYQLSQVRLAQRQTKEAIKLAEKAIKLDGKQAAYYSHLGNALGQLMNESGPFQQFSTVRRMREAFEKAVKLDPNDIAGLLGLSRYYMSAPPTSGGDSQKAAEFARRVQKLDPYQGDFELGRIAQQATLYAVALEHFEAASRAKPDELAPQAAGAICLGQLGRREEARARLEQILSRKPNYSPALRALEALDELGSKKN